VKVLEKALKIRELARRGVDGERRVARDMFEALLTKNDIPEQALDRFMLLKQGKLQLPRVPVPSFQGVPVVIVGGWGNPWGYGFNLPGFTTTDGSSVTFTGFF
jgi:hypothetical protein